MEKGGSVALGDTVERRRRRGGLGDTDWSKQGRPTGWTRAVRTMVTTRTTPRLRELVSRQMAVPFLNWKATRPSPRLLLQLWLGKRAAVAPSAKWG